MMMIIGAHLSIAQGFEKATRSMLNIGGNTFQYFPRNPRGGAVKKYDEDDVINFKRMVNEHQVQHILCHAPYTYNFCSNKDEVRLFAKKSLREDLERLEFLPCELYNLHPGSHVGLGTEQGIKHLTDILNEVLTDDITSMVLLETMSGKGTEIGRTFEELACIIDGIRKPDQIGVCMDSCHVFSAGYDIVEDLEGVLEEFNKIIGLERLKGIHLNDSLKPFKSNKDRHAGIGKGLIGLEPLLSMLVHPLLRDLPFYLETPYDEAGHMEEITMIKEILCERGMNF